MVGGTEHQDDFETKGGDFSVRVVDQFFRRWVWYVAPIVVLALIGFRAASNVPQEYVTTATLSASSNPLVEAPEVRGTTIGAFEPPAVGIARLINEQLRSDAFVEIVAERTGLDEALSTGVIAPDVIRGQVFAGAKGENLLAVQASWGDSETAYLLVEATVKGYLDLLAEIVAIDSVEAIDFWTDVRAGAQERADTALAVLRTYTQDLPELADGEELSVAQEFELARLNSALDAALADVRGAQDQIDSAELNVEQSKSEAGRQVRIVDPPQRATAPTAETFKKITTMMMFTLIGILISAVALVITTMVDHSVRSIAQLRAAAGASSTAVVPRSKVLRNWSQSHEQAA